MNTNLVKDKSQIWQLAFFIILQIFIFSTLFQTIYTIPYSSIGLFFDFSSEVMHGHLPYRDFVLEYPPFSLFFFLLPRFFTSTYLIYAIMYQTLTVIFVVIGLFVFYDISRRLGQAPWKIMTIYTLGIVAIGPIIPNHFDIFPAIFVLLALYFFWIDKHGIAWAFLALGTMTKIFPAAIAPLFLICYYRNRQYHLMWQGILTFAVVSLAVLLPFLILSPESLWNLYAYHAGRGIQLETTYSSVLMLAHKLGWVTAHSAFNFGSWNIVGPVENILTGLSTFLVLLFLVAAYGYFYIRSQPGKVDVMRLGSWSFLVVLIILITSKVLSPQYLVWLIPLLPLVVGRWRYVLWVMFVLAGGLTYVIFPHLYLQLIDFGSDAVTVLAVRNLLLILMTVITAVSLRNRTEVRDKITNQGRPA